MADSPASIYELSFTANDGQEVPLQQFEGKPLLIVNTASKCGYTPQYKGLQQIYEDLGPDLVVIGFPCDQFAHQEPGDDDQIKEFCEMNYGVTFPLSTKVDVNGSRTHPVFAYLKDRAGGLLGSSMIKWNFTKFLVSPDGRTVKRYAPKTDPEIVKMDAQEMLGRDS